MDSQVRQCCQWCNRSPSVQQRKCNVLFASLLLQMAHASSTVRHHRLYIAHSALSTKCWHVLLCTQHSSQIVKLTLKVQPSAPANIAPNNIEAANTTSGTMPNTTTKNTPTVRSPWPGFAADGRYFGVGLASHCSPYTQHSETTMSAKPTTLSSSRPMPAAAAVFVSFPE